MIGQRRSRRILFDSIQSIYRDFQCRDAMPLILLKCTRLAVTTSAPWLKAIAATAISKSSMMVPVASSSAFILPKLTDESESHANTPITPSNRIFCAANRACFLDPESSRSKPYSISATTGGTVTISPGRRVDKKFFLKRLDRGRLCVSSDRV